MVSMQPRMISAVTASTAARAATFFFRATGRFGLRFEAIAIANLFLTTEARSHGDVSASSVTPCLRGEVF